MILLKQRGPVSRLTPAQEVHSNYRCSKAWLADALMCNCVFPPLRMRQTFFGFVCQNDRCRDFISKRDAKLVRRTAMNTASVNAFMKGDHASSLVRRAAKAEKTGNYLRAFND